MDSDDGEVKQIDLNDYEVIKELNRGGFGIVFLVEEKATGKQFAAKVNIIDLGNVDGYFKCVIREIGILSDANFPTIVGFQGFSLKDFKGFPNVTILLDFYQKGSLVDVLKNAKGKKSFTNTNRHIILTGIAHGMMTLHRLDIIHRDLKPGNVLIDDDYQPHITDFGMSKHFDPSDPNQQSQWGGTPLYMAPEIWSQHDYDTAVDVYAFGLLMYEVVTGIKPFSEIVIANERQFKRKIVNEEYRPPFKDPIKKEIKGLIKSCWDPNPNERPTFEDIFEVLSLKNDQQYLLEGANAKEVKKYVDYIINNGTQADEIAMKHLKKEINKQQERYERLKHANEIFRKSTEKKEPNKLKKSLSATQAGKSNDRGILYKLKSRENENDPYDRLFLPRLSSRDPYNVLFPGWNGFYSSSDNGKFFFELNLRDSITLTGFLIQSEGIGAPKSYTIFVNDHKLMSIDEDEQMHEKKYAFVKLSKPVTCEQFKFVQDGPNWDHRDFIRIKRIELYTKEHPLKATPSLQTRGFFATQRYLYRGNVDPHQLPVRISTDTFSFENVENAETKQIVGTDHGLGEFLEFKFTKGLVKVDSYRLKRTKDKDTLRGWDVIGTTADGEEVTISSIKEKDINEHKLLDVYPSKDKETMFKSVKITNTTENWNGDIQNVLKFHHFDFFGEYYE